MSERTISLLFSVTLCCGWPALWFLAGWRLARAGRGLHWPALPRLPRVRMRFKDPESEGR